MKKIRISSEAVYIISNILISFSVAMVATTDFGLSMIVSPAYLLSKKLGFITFGQAEYILQGLLFIAFCILVKKIKPIFFVSFGTCLFYGALLDLWRKIIPAFNESITPPGSLPLGIRILFFALGTVITAFSIGLYFRTYIYPQVYDFVVKELSDFFKIDRTRFKIIYDCCFLTVSVIMTFAFFGKIVGIGIGTLITTAVNGILIKKTGDWFDKYFEVVPRFKKGPEIFKI